MNRDQAVSYVHSLGKFGSRPGLSRITELCRRLGDPQDKLRFVHVAGTNGKGSVSAMITSVLRAAGMRVGTYTSPYILRFNERIAVDGEPIGDEELAALITEVRPEAEALDDQITEFELITAAAFLWFARRECDIVVLEVGLGGRYDATNIIKTPVLSVITGIALDHTAVLGDTVEKIAAEKAGIIKPGVPVIYGEVSEGAARVIEDAAGEKGAPVSPVDFSRLSDITLSLDGTRFSVDGAPYRIPLIGEYQPRNALTALTAAEALGVDPGAARRGLETVEWKGRFEILRRRPVVIYDGAHNPQGAASAAATVRALFGGAKPVLVTGMMADKDCRKAAGIFAEVCSLAVCVRPDNPRAMAPDELAAIYRESGAEARAFGDFDRAVAFALDEAKRRGIPLFAAGSLYMYAQFVGALDFSPKG